MQLPRWIRCITLTLASVAVLVDVQVVFASEIRVALSGDMRSSYPGVRRDSNSDDILAHIVEPLVVHTADMGIAPMAAETYEVSDNYRHFRFTLREGLIFHNGEDVKASHIKYVWDKVLDPDTGFQCLTFFDGTMGSKVTAVEAIDARTLVIELDKPNAIFLEMLAYIQCPVAVLHPSSWNSDGSWNSPIGTGPYKLKEWKKGRHILLEKHQGYIPRTEKPSGLAGAKIAHADYIRWVTITDELAAKAALVSGQVDLIYTKSPVSAMELRRNKRVTVLDSPGLARRSILVQTSDPLFSQLKIRQALAHAIDLPTFADVATFGLASANPSVFPILDDKTPAPPWLAYNPEKARSLLKEAGYGGEEIVLQTTRTLQTLFDTAMIAEAMLRKAGFNVRVEVLEWGTMINNYFAGDFQVMAFEFSPRMTPFMGYQTLLGQKSLFPYIWEDDLAYEMLTGSIAETDTDKRQALYHRLHERMMQEVPTINLFNVPVIDVVSRRLKNYKPWPGIKPRLWNTWLADGK